MKETQLSLNLDYGISKEQACILCHLSSECEGCCVKCKAENKNDGCSGQACSQPFREKEGNRWDTWMHLVSTSLSELKRFIPVKYRKHLKTKK
nr:MAG TPA: hypothetical protein [Caudoviricetes sp.]